MIKKLAILLIIVAVPLAIGLLFTYEVIKIDWVSFMEIQPSFKAQRDPLPLPARSVPVQGAAYIPDSGAPVNPVPADKVSLDRGKQLYEIDCALCHGKDAKGTGPFAGFLLPRKPANLLEGNAKNGSDGAIFMVITNGVTGSMPPLKENLDVRGRWDVVNYVRSLQK